MTKAIILVGLGGGIGSIFRYLSSLAVNRYFPAAFPWGTFAVNVAGCFLMGILLGIAGRTEGSNQELKFLFVTGFCGGFTTFSAFAAENLAMLQAGQAGPAVLYIGASILGGLLAVWWGYNL